MAEGKSALFVAYNGLMAAGFALRLGNISRAEEIINAALKKLNYEHTIDVQRAVFNFDEESDEIS